MNTIPAVANEGGKYGAIIKKALGERPYISYTKLAEMFKEAGVKDPKDGRELKKSRIFSYADDQTNTPDWFMVAFGKVFYDDPDWWTRRQSDTLRSSGKAMRKRKLTMLRTSDGESQTSVDVYGAPQGGSITAILIENNLARPAFADTDLVLIDNNARKATEARVYATLEKEGKASTVAFRKAVWDDARDCLVLKAARERLKDVDASEAEILGMVIVRYDRFQPEDMPRGSFDYDGYLFGEGW